MAWVPPVNLPDVTQRDFGRELYAMASGIGDTIYQGRRDQVGDAQWQEEQARLLRAQELAQANADRNYGLDLQRLAMDAQGGGAGGEFYGSPQWFERDDGSMGYGVLSKGGQFQEVEPPPGAKWAPTVTFQNTGTAFDPRYTRGGGSAGAPIPIDVAGKNRQEKMGDAGGIAAAALPMIEYQSEVLLGSIDNVLNDPNLPYLTGPAGGRAPTFMSTDPGGMAATQAKINQVVQKSFLQAYDALRGAGAITEQEGAAAKSAWTRLVSQEMDDQSYRVALEDYRREAAKMLDVARQRATMGVQGTVPAAGAPPAGGGVERWERGPDGKLRPVGG